MFKDRYQIQDAKPLGKGSFGQVSIRLQCTPPPHASFHRAVMLLSHCVGFIRAAPRSLFRICAALVVPLFSHPHSFAPSGCSGIRHSRKDLPRNEGQNPAPTNIGFQNQKTLSFNQHSRGRRCVTLVAPQIIKNKRAFHEQAQVEIQMLQLFKNFGEVSELEQSGARRRSHAAGDAQSPLHCSNAGLLRVQESSVHRYAFREICKHFVVKSSSFLYCFACSSLSIPSLPAFQLRSF